MLITKTVTMRWHPINKKRYEEKGYIYTKMKDEFEIYSDDLPNYSQEVVDIKCDSCGEILSNRKWFHYKRYVKEGGLYYCNICASKIIGNKKSKETRLGKSKSFEQWCCDNLPDEETDNILLRWDHQLNGLGPKDVTYSSNGLNKKGYWFKCLKYLEHASEQKSINGFAIRGRNINCNQCNSILISHPYLEKFFVSIDDMRTHSAGSNKRIIAQCPDCGYRKEMQIVDLVNQGFCCSRCSDGISYPEKFIHNLLEQLSVEFITQLGKITFSWCDIYRYDFYIHNMDCIIEVNGKQHYEENSDWGSLAETQNNDNLKKYIAMVNGIKNYICVDCRNSRIEWIKNSIMDSNLPKLFGFAVDDIDWLKCHEPQSEFSS